MREIKQTGESSYLFSRYIDPIAKIKPGEEVIIYTDDTFENKITKETDIPSEIIGNYLNPQTGPIYIEGADPGDTLIAHIIDIQPTRNWAVSILNPYLGGLTTTRTTRMLHNPFPEKVWIYKLQDSMLVNNTRLSFPWRPFMGTIGTAPEVEAISSLTPGDFGGNMDVPDIKVGNSIHLPVNVEGAYFYTGNCHAGQGEGKLCGTGLEITGKVTIKFELIKAKAISWPRIESPTELMTVGSARPMEDAAQIAYAELLEWMVELGWEELEAYQALTQKGKLYVGNMVATNYSLVAKIEKKYAFIE